MERLTTRNIAGVAVYKNPFECDRCGDTIWRVPDYGNGSPTEKLADYEDTEEQGLLLQLPTEAYFIKDNIVRKGWVQELVYSPCRKLLLDIRYDDNSLDSYRGYVGNTVFLTQADRIRSFSDDELAKFIEQVSTDSMETISFGTKEYEEIWEHKETALQWLQSEVEE